MKSLSEKAINLSVEDRLEFRLLAVLEFISPWKAIVLGRCKKSPEKWFSF